MNTQAIAKFGFGRGAKLAAVAVAVPDSRLEGLTEPRRVRLAGDSPFPSWIKRAGKGASDAEQPRTIFCIRFTAQAGRFPHFGSPSRRDLPGNSRPASSLQPRPRFSGLGGGHLRPVLGRALVGRFAFSALRRTAIHRLAARWAGNLFVRHGEIVP